MGRWCHGKWTEGDSESQKDPYYLIDICDSTLVTVWHYNHQGHLMEVQLIIFTEKIGSDS